MLDRAKNAYALLVSAHKELSLLQSCSAVLEWDESTYLPAGAVEQRGAQLALLAGLEHRRATDPRIGEWLACVAQSDLMHDPAVAADVHAMGRSHTRALRLPVQLVEELASAQVVAQQVWSVARERSDFALLQPHLRRIIDLKRQEAAAVAPELDPYDALLDEYEPGVRAADLQPIFDVLHAGLADLVSTLRDRPPPPPVLHRPATHDQQRRLCERIAARVGYDFAAGRLDTSDHPFTIYLGPGDTRITTRFVDDDLTHALFATLHEVGHGLYNQGLDTAAFGRAAGEAMSTALHESQARLWENIVGRSLGFWRDLLPQAEQILPALQDISPHAAFRCANALSPGLIRISADEFTYDLHIAVRFQIERALIAGQLAVADLPTAWNDAYRQQLGVQPPDDAAGCLQDGHWAAGLFGYFPTYTLGNVMAAQLFAAAEQTLGSQDDCFACGNYAPLLSWLRTHVHQLGSVRSAYQIVEAATGLPPHPGALLARLRARAQQIGEG